MNERILDHRRAMDYFDEMMAGMRRQVEAAVAERFKEARRIAPQGVDEADLQEAIFKAVRDWLPGPDKDYRFEHGAEFKGPGPTG